ncbi:MAG: hypothetical protein KatS3mg110_1919 [Pirellulaceae bacterium]|nr:MAG: hypothetical protein KatS3mg110_1919 [Pirellulaceae bacterium]
MQWAKKTEIALCTLILWLGICRSKFYLWQQHYGKVREQDRWIPRDHWITPEERRAIIDYARKHPRVGYRRLTFMCCEFRQFLPLCHHITTSPYYPQSSGQIERSFGSLKR